MGLLDDTAIFTAIIQQGGFSHAAKYLGLSNGLISRRIAQLEASLGVTLIKRTTRQIQLTPEGELFWQHAQRIQQELDSAVSLIQVSAKKPKGIIRVSTPTFFGRHYLANIAIKFMNDFPDIKIALHLSNQRIDPIKEEMDVLIRGAGYVEENQLADSNMQSKVLLKEKIGLYASPNFIAKHNEPLLPADLPKYPAIQFLDNSNEKWTYAQNGVSNAVQINPAFISNDIETNLGACINSVGIGKFTMLNAKSALIEKKLCPILAKYDWGSYYLYALYPQQKNLPKRTRLLLDFLEAHIKHL